jgi:hypothetical protein
MSLRRNSITHDIEDVLSVPVVSQRRKSVSFFSQPHNTSVKEPETDPVPEPVVVHKLGIKGICESVHKVEKRLDEIKSCQCNDIEVKFKQDIDKLVDTMTIISRKLDVLEHELRDLIDN